MCVCVGGETGADPQPTPAPEGVRDGGESGPLPAL